MRAKTQRCRDSKAPRFARKRKDAKERVHRLDNNDNRDIAIGVAGASPVEYKHNETLLYCAYCGGGGRNNGFKIAGVWQHMHKTCIKATEHEYEVCSLFPIPYCYFFKLYFCLGVEGRDYDMFCAPAFRPKHQ